MKSYGQYCALARGLDVVGDRWTLLIVRELLSLGECRYADLQRGLPGIATNLLAQRLRDLEESGLVQRAQRPRPVNAVVFSLTDRGAGLGDVVRELVKWGAPLMPQPRPGDEFRAHWLLIPLRGLCRDREPRRPREVVRVGTLDDGCDVIAERGTVQVTASRADETPDATVIGDPGALVGLFTGALPVAAAQRSGVSIDGSIAAVRRILGTMSTTQPTKGT